MQYFLAVVGDEIRTTQWIGAHRMYKFTNNTKKKITFHRMGWALDALEWLQWKRLMGQRLEIEGPLVALDKDGQPKVRRGERGDRGGRGRGRDRLDRERDWAWDLEVLPLK